MKIYKETVLALADSQRDYCEKKSNANLDEWTVNAGNGNYTKYSRDLDAIRYFNGPKQGHEWCAQWINWLFWMASGRNIRETKKALYIPEDGENLAAGCEFIRAYFRKVGAYDAKPHIGDLILFTTTKGSTNADHIGLVTDISADGKKIYTIEGNKDNKVCNCVYPYDYWKILGYCHPHYANEDGAVSIKVNDELVYEWRAD